ncbi:carbon-nitrogen hydrolase family protein [Butyrivibrio sp. XB500-5]|uniref:carbon-nitrogen hydrolase family protein n=1 Tax=Butyrivibrio sp. XB500-5 TaxID=2364880 RepID=UPI000EA8BC18|nr:carbon-nitrogen hydrolase family protein [Butyrivibrio sp. XB500-5]RKM62866.1 carbon-nitrogen hydrolase family protein [Butyrivibrio sp. XB500-5]
MRLAAYQFAVTGNISQNMNIIRSAVSQAASAHADLIAFPECALSGYPPRDIGKSSDVDIEAINKAILELQEISERYKIRILIGSVAYDEAYYNRAYLLAPSEPICRYGKRALYGWDEENFSAGSEQGIFEIGEYKIGVRICYEIRFPEYFRELYKSRTDLNIVLFNDVSDNDDAKRYDVIKSHLITRAVENVTPFLSVNAISPYQTAPTCFVDASGTVIEEHERNAPGLLIYDFRKKDLNFGEIGRKRYSDKLLGI